MTPASYLCVGGVEIVNGNRALTYARTADPRLTVALRPDMYPEPGGPIPENLACWCEAIEDPARAPFEVTYGNPDADQAPWWAASRPESGDFLGLHGQIDLGSVTGRTVTPRGLLGGTVGALRRGPRLVQVTATMFAATPAGMAYGERWLVDALASCCDADATIIPSCESEPRHLRRVGLVDGPRFTSLGAPDCLMQQAAFQLVSGLPWLYGDAEDALAEQALSNLRHCAVVETDDWVGDLAVRVTISTGSSGLPAGTVVEAVPLPSGVTDCADSAGRPAAVRYELAALPANHTLTIDAAQHTVELVQDSSGQVVGGTDYLTFTGPMRWVELGPCTTACVCVDATAGGPAGNTVRIETIAREL